MMMHKLAWTYASAPARQGWSGHGLRASSTSLSTFPKTLIIMRKCSDCMRRFLAPMWVAILSPALLKERPGKFTYVAIPMCLLGVYLIAEAKTGDLGTQHIRTIGIVVAVFQV